MKNSLKYFALLVLVFGVFFLTRDISAKSYDLYVDVDFNGTEDGSKDNPYKTIARAIEKADDNDKIYIDKGDYKENLVINKEVNFFGEDLEGVVIKGQLEVSEDFEAQDFTVEGNVAIESGAGIIFNNLMIKEANKIAVEAYAGNGKIIIKNSTIKKAGTKGMYIQRGRDIVITGCNVYGNDEEGVDLRSNVDGTISGNNIYDNGESGIEFLVSKSELSIKNNTLKNNGSSGIAAQYYEDYDKEGEINLSGNTFSGNNNYGLDCVRPQGGETGGGYWSKSIDLIDNKFSSNKKGTINAYCAISQPVPPVSEVLQEAQKKERQTAIIENEKEKEVQAQITEQNKQKTIQDNKYNLNKLVVSKKELKDQVSAEKEVIEKRGSILTFLIGPNYGAIENIKEVAPGFGESLSEFNDISQKLIDAENKNLAQMEKDDILSFVEEVNTLIVEKNSKFSLLGWFFRIIS